MVTIQSCLCRKRFHIIMSLHSIYVNLIPHKTPIQYVKSKQPKNEECLEPNLQALGSISQPIKVKDCQEREKILNKTFTKLEKEKIYSFVFVIEANT